MSTYVTSDTRGCPKSCVAVLWNGHKGGMKEPPKCPTCNDLKQETNLAHTLLDAFKVPRVNSTGVTYPLIDRISVGMKSSGVEAANIMIESLGLDPKDIPPCPDCGARQGELCNKTCTQDSFR